MRRWGLVVLGFALASAGVARAGPVPTSGSAEVTQRVAIDMSGDVAFRTLDMAASAPLSISASSPLDASVRVTGEQGDSLSLAVPPEIDLARDGGGEFLTVATRELAGVDLSRPTVMSLGTVNFRIGGTVEAAVNQIVPGNYRGVLLITVQFN